MADFDEEWTFVRTDIKPVNLDRGTDKQLVYANGLWVLVGEDPTAGSTTWAVSTSSDPLDGWDRKVSSTSADFYRPSHVVSWGEGKWAMTAGPNIIWTEDSWDTYTVTTPVFGGANVNRFQDLAFDGTNWAAITVDASKLYRATSITGTWTEVTRATLGVGVGSGVYGPLAIATNGSRWVVAAWSFSGSVMMATTTDITGAWTVPGSNVPASGSATDYPRMLKWLADSQEWVVSIGGKNDLYSAGAAAGSWAAVPSNPPLDVCSVALAEGYFVAYGGASGTSGNATYWKGSSTISVDEAWTRIDNNLNADAQTSDGLYDLATDGRVFLLSGKPRGQSYYGVSVSPDLSAGDGWGLVLT